MPNDTTQSVHEQILASMLQLAAAAQQQGVQLQMPPRSTETMRTRFTAIDPGKMLTAEIPFHDELTNPTGVMQGGFLCAAFDEVFGPLSYMAARGPAVTLEMSTSFLRPFSAKDKTLTIRADVTSATKSFLLLEAKATNPEGKLIAIAKVTCAVLTDSQTARFAESRS